MNFNEYLTELQREVLQFQAWWSAMAKLNPEHFPLEMEPGDWDEQFRMWQTTPDQPVYKIAEEAK